jgi:hypothetical protein
MPEKYSTISFLDMAPAGTVLGCYSPDPMDLSAVRVNIFTQKEFKL